MFKSFVLASKLRGKGELLISKINSNAYKNAYYSVNPETNLYSFWSWRLGSGLQRIDSGLRPEQAAFKLILMGGIK